MTAPLVLDVTRSLLRAARRQPVTGVDRVEVTYLQAALACTDRPVRFVALGRRGWRWVSAARVRRLVAEPRDHPAVQALDIEQIARAAAPAQGVTLRRWAGEALHALEDRFAPATAAAGLPRGAVFLKASHDRLDREAAYAELAAAGPKIVVFVHDVQPFEVPEYFVPGEFERHRARMATVARHAGEVLVNSQDTAERFLAACRRFGWREPPCTVLPLGIPGSLERRAEAPRGDHFVMLGTVQPRKNHVFMLQLWLELAAQGGAVPKLVIIGRRGWLSEPVFRMLRRSPVLQRHVVHAGALDDSTTWAVLGSARGLLMPSHAEGYALPIAEALALGVPVLASDLPAHREVGGGRVTYLDPIDGPGWLAAISGLADGPPAETPPPYEPPTWAEHLAGLWRVLDGRPS